MPPSLRRRISLAVAALAVGAGAMFADAGTQAQRVVIDTAPSTPIPDGPKRVRINADGALDLVTVTDHRVEVSGWAANLDGPAVTAVAITVDDRRLTSVPAGGYRPDVAAATGDAAGAFTASFEIDDGAHTFCIHTVPGDNLVTCERVASEDTLGILRTPSGVMTPIRRVRANDYVVTTPCGKRGVVRGGTRIRTTQILIDPGHGGSEVASVGPNGLGEKQLNLDVALRAAAALRERGYSVELTRTDDTRLPIETRAELANALDPDLFLSLHHNGGATGRTPVPGTQVYYQHDDRESRRAAGILYEELFAAASAFPTQWVGNSKDGVSTRLNAAATDFYGIHRRTPSVPSVITEFLWVSNGPEARLLARGEVKDAEAEAIATGIDRWYRTANTGSGYLAPFVDTFDSGGGGFEGCVDPALS